VPHSFDGTVLSDPAVVSDLHSCGWLGVAVFM
jgi:hypothetical protein